MGSPRLTVCFEALPVLQFAEFFSVLCQVPRTFGMGPGWTALPTKVPQLAMRRRVQISRPGPSRRQRNVHYSVAVGGEPDLASALVNLVR